MLNPHPEAISETKSNTTSVVPSPRSLKKLSFSFHSFPMDQSRYPSILNCEMSHLGDSFPLATTCSMTMNHVTRPVSVSNLLHSSQTRFRSDRRSCTTLQNARSLNLPSLCKGDKISKPLAGSQEPPVLSPGSAFETGPGHRCFCTLCYHVGLRPQGPSEYPIAPLN